MTDFKNKRLMAIYLMILLVFLFSVAAYFVESKDYSLRRTALIGDGICGNMPGESGQDSCCAQAHEDDITIQCVGRWQYVSGIEECQYICEGGLPTCPNDENLCENGSNVTRSPKNDCDFNECPVEEDINGSLN